MSSPSFVKTQIPLWRPTNAEATPISQYRHHVNKKFHTSLRNSHELHKWSITQRHDFWKDLWGYVGMIPPLPTHMQEVYDSSKGIHENPRWFNGVLMNYAENVLEGRNGDGVALIGLREGEALDGDVWSWSKLRDNVRRARSALLRMGIRRGDRVAVLMSNSAWTIALFLATVTFGGVFTSISPDMGLEGVVSRLLQVEPKILFADSCQTYKARKQSMKEKIGKVVDALRANPPRVYIVPLVEGELHDYPVLSDFLALSSSGDGLVYERFPFSQPMIILYSSGTTGPPKCIVHQHGIILQLKKIAILHNSLTERDIVFQYSSTSWVLWNIMNGHLSVGAALVCYDGSPLYPDPSTKLRILQHHRCTYFGTSPRYLLELEMSNIKPSDFDLSHLRMVVTTGATLTTDQFHWFYNEFPKTVHLSSIAGGTEICTSWIASDPAGPIHAGEMQLPALGQDVDVADSETGESIKHTGQAGELVCRTPFPSMPIWFWGDDDGSKYKEAYFERFDSVNVWAQHDWIQFNPLTGGCQIHGRSDGTLNPSGIRFGSSEIYSIVESPPFTTTIHNTLCCGRKRPQDADESVFLFIQMRPGQTFTQILRRQIEVAIRTSLSARHVPRFILQIEDIPVTINGKKVEIAVKKILSGSGDGKVSSTVANPECLAQFVKFRDFEERRLAKL